MKRAFLIVLGGTLLLATTGSARAKPKPKATTQDVRSHATANKDNGRPPTLSSRCRSYCKFTQNCLANICSKGPTVTVQVCYEQCVAADDLSEAELQQTLLGGCARSNAVYCESGVLDADACTCNAPRAQCREGFRCDVPLNENRWACSTEKATQHLPCNAYNPCPAGNICIARFGAHRSGVCAQACHRGQDEAATGGKTPQPAGKPPQPTDK